MPSFVFYAPGITIKIIGMALSTNRRSRYEHQICGFITKLFLYYQQSQSRKYLYYIQFEREWKFDTCSSNNQ